MSILLTMTCIVGLKHDGAVYIGGDSASVDPGYGLYVTGEPKVFVDEPYIIGFCGSWRVGQVLQYIADFPHPPKDEDKLKKFMVRDFVDTIRGALESAGAAYIRHEEEWMHDSAILVGVCAKLYRIDEDFQVVEVADPYAAVGCGEQIALGAMFATDKRKKPTDRIQIALEAAERFSAGVRGPFTILSV